MKLLCIFITLTVLGHSSDLSDRLCAANEELIISFKTKTHKVVSLCRDKTGKYMVYRFGTKSKVELQYPKKPDANSWNLFHYNGQWRFGGKANAGFGALSVKFTNIDTRYKIFEDWSDEDGSNEFGLEVNKEKAASIKLAIDKSSQIGTLLRLNDVPQIKNEGDEQ